ncbi:MAG: hypothetical protein F6K24_35515, partial [Okeania sp. SIO2D1]|nr:hypothetical protein [Okeania sp. SIO2D1]
ASGYYLTIGTSSFDDTIKLWCRDGTLLKTLEHEDSVLKVIISPNSNIKSG